MISQLFFKLKEDKIPSYKSVKELLDKNPELLTINAALKQADVDIETRDRINHFFIENKEMIKNIYQDYRQ